MESSKLFEAQTGLSFSISTQHLDTAIIFDINSCEIEDHATGEKNKTNHWPNSFSQRNTGQLQSRHTSHIGRRKHVSEFIREIGKYSSKTAERTGKRWKLKDNFVYVVDQLLWLVPFQFSRFTRNGKTQRKILDSMIQVVFEICVCKSQRNCSILCLAEANRNHHPNR